MNRPSYKELWLYERKDRDEQLQWIRDAVDGNAKFRNSEPPYSEEEELARKIMRMHARIAELSQAVGLITTLKPTMVMDANHPLDMVREVVEHVTARIAELERDFDMLFRSSANKQPRKNTQTLTFEYGMESEIDQLTARWRQERQVDL